LNPFPPIEELIPHRPPMRWVDALIDCAETTATCTARFSAGQLAANQGAVTETALVECVAQTVAAALGHRLRIAGNSETPNHGLLVAVSNFKIISQPPINQTLTIEVRELKRLGPMLMIAGKISCEGRLVAQGELSLYA
jgi:predicted hotdog family 3-hydroxylacyl-ACP dehydratase